MKGDPSEKDPKTKELSFMAIAGGVGAISSSFLIEVPDNVLVFIGTIAAIAGGGLGILLHKRPAKQIAIGLVLALAVCILAILAFDEVLHGEPGPAAALQLRLLAAAIFLPIGLLIEITGLKWD